MRVASVESSAFATVAYDEARQLLQLEFWNRAVYQYFCVPAAVHQSLVAAPSKGRYFNQAIRGSFPYRVLENCASGADREASNAVVR